ncbi:MAG: chemotaxis protein methyltransferase CheR [Moritella dasanensis]|jgi:chemotaxis protein methyltransferase CheR
MTDREKSFELSQSDFNFICQYTYEIAGIVLNASKKEMVYRRLTRIIRARNIASFTEYCDLLKSEPEKEKDYFINAITTNLTNFFREQHHFDYMLQHELPKIIENSLTNYKRLRIWSSASSTGEEPYSIAITLLEGMKSSLDQWDAKILATDIDSDVLSVGKGGVYDNHRIEDVPKKITDKYFHKGIGKNKNKVKVDEKLSKLITFKQLNLLCDWPMKGPFDIIFCRNVVIYFDKETQQKLFARYYEILAPGGLLILGHSENLGAHQVHFENVGRTIYRKVF